MRFTRVPVQSFVVCNFISISLRNLSKYRYNLKSIEGLRNVIQIINFPLRAIKYLKYAIVNYLLYPRKITMNNKHYKM